MSDLKMQGKTVLITGATDGIGKQAAKELAQMGAKIVLVGRSEEKCKSTVDEIVQFAGHSNVSYLISDLSSMIQVRNLAAKFLEKNHRLDVLINNAGAAFMSRQITEDGFERTYALNHLAYFLLTELLLETLKGCAPSRVINVSSGSHFRGKIRFWDIHLRWFYFVLTAYSQSKLANVLHTFALARRLEGSQVTANCLHPGLVRTGIFGKVKGVSGFLEKILLKDAISVKEGAETIVYLASSADVDRVSGKYFYKKKARASAPVSSQVEIQERLWKMSEDQLKPWLGKTNI